MMCVSWGEPCPPSWYSRVQVHVLGGAMPSVRGTQGVKMCVLGGDTPSVQGTQRVIVCPGGRYALRPGYSRG